MESVIFHLPVFDGPLDLLLHLLSKNKVDIVDIPIADILEQYMAHIAAMESFALDVASEFITMAAQLMYIKSKMLLPVYEEEPGDDPRAELVQALLEYQRFKQIGPVFEDLSQLGRDLFVKPQQRLEKTKKLLQYEYSPDVLYRAMEQIFERAERKMPPPVSSFRGIVGRDAVPVGDKIAQLVELFTRARTVDFSGLVLASRTRSEVVALFLAVLELSKTRKIWIDEQEDRYVLSLYQPEGETQDAAI